MMAQVHKDPPWAWWREFIASRLGLHFPPQRQIELERGVAAAAVDLGLKDAHALMQYLTSREVAPTDLQTLAAHLTVGETYFFRDQHLFTALAQQVLPSLIEPRRTERRLRLWSAACCTGEEPYSLAILLEQCLPEIDAWHTTLLGTDINPKFLQKAAAGVYRDWSFRATPAALRQQYFAPTVDGQFALAPRIKARVKLELLNLVEDSFPSLATDTQAMDLICCRNVLMYFTPPQIRRVIDNLYRSLVDGGWLVVSPTEASRELFARFSTVNVAGAVLFQKRERAETLTTVDIDLAAALEEVAPAATVELETPSSVTPLRENPLRANAVRANPAALASAARAAADSGELASARVACEQWIAVAPLDPVARYLQAAVAQEQGDLATAQRSFAQALYLDPDFVMAHLALGHLARANHDRTAARRHLTNALALLEHCPDAAELPESDGLSAARLRTMVASLLAIEVAS